MSFDFLKSHPSVFIIIATFFVIALILIYWKNQRKTDENDGQIELTNIFVQNNTSGFQETQLENDSNATSTSSYEFSTNHPAPSPRENEEGDYINLRRETSSDNKNNETQGYSHAMMEPTYSNRSTLNVQPGRATNSAGYAYAYATQQNILTQHHNITKDGYSYATTDDDDDSVFESSRPSSPVLLRKEFNTNPSLENMAVLDELLSNQKPKEYVSGGYVKIDDIDNVVGPSNAISEQRITLNFNNHESNFIEIIKT